MNGELPNQQEFSKFEHEVTHHTMMHEAFRTFLFGFRHDAHPMAMLVGMLGSMGELLSQHARSRRRRTAPYGRDPSDRESADDRGVPAIAIRSAGRSATRRTISNTCTRFLHMLKEVPSEPLELNPVAAKALDLLFILHADHEQNASTSTVRLVGSTGANPYACVAAGVAALWGPAHGGANEAVLKMLEEIGRPENVQSADRQGEEQGTRASA